VLCSDLPACGFIANMQNGVFTGTMASSESGCCTENVLEKSSLNVLAQKNLLTASDKDADEGGDAGGMRSVLKVLKDGSAADGVAGRPRTILKLGEQIV